MTKTLNEQWKDDTLTNGYYYTKKITYPETYPSCDEHIIESIDLYGCDYGFDDDMDICEVLAAVPSYDEYKRLVSKTDKSEKQIADISKKVERLQEQLHEATELLCDQVNRDEKWDGGFDTHQLSFIEKMGCYTNEKGEYVLPDKWGVK